MQSPNKIPLAQAEEEIHSKRRTVRYDIRDLTVEAIAEKYNDSLDSKDGGSEKIIVLSSFSLSYEDMIKYYPLYSGNLDALAIKKIFEKCGFIFEEKTTELQTVKTMRNQLAHGEASFEEVGREISSQQIEKLIEKTFDYLEKATQAVTCYLSNKNYLKAQHNR